MGLAALTVLSAAVAEYHPHRTVCAANLFDVFTTESLRVPISKSAEPSNRLLIFRD